MDIEEIITLILSGLTILCLLVILYAIIAGIWQFNPPNISYLNIKLFSSAIVIIIMSVIVVNAIDK